MKDSESPEFECCGPLTSKNSSLQVELPEPSEEDTNTEQMKDPESPELECCGPPTSKNSSHQVELPEPSEEDINTELLTALKTINSDSTGTIDRIGLRKLLGGFRPSFDEPDVVDLLFLALGIGLGERCCLRRLLRTLHPHLSDTLPAKLSGDDVREAIQSFLDADSTSQQQARAPTAIHALAASPKPGPARDRDAPGPSDLEAQPPPAPGPCAGRRRAALVCCALLVAAVVTFGICLAVAKLGPGSSS
jgi:hypothetical protein